MEKKRIVLGVEYDGNPWQGWQTQPHHRTVQDQLERALERFCETPIKTHCAGRTDAGVHALEQVVHFDTTCDRPPYSWVSGVNAFLPPSIAVRWASQILGFDPDAQNGFHARFSAFSRTYHYVIFTDPVRSPLWAGRAGWVFRPLEHETMQEAADLLLGEHDFTAFRAAGCQAKSPIKHMYAVKISRQDKLIVCSFKANAFLHHMVRNIVGSLIFVGSGRREPNWIRQLLEERDRSQAAPTFMADGLYLAKVSYDKAWNLPQLNDEDLFGLNVDFPE